MGLVSAALRKKEKGSKEGRENKEKNKKKLGVGKARKKQKRKGGKLEKRKKRTASSGGSVLVIRVALVQSSRDGRRAVAD